MLCCLMYQGISCLRVCASACELCVCVCEGVCVYCRGLALPRYLLALLSGRWVRGGGKWGHRHPSVHLSVCPVCTPVTNLNHRPACLAPSPSLPLSLSLRVCVVSVRRPILVDRFLQLVCGLVTRAAIAMATRKNTSLSVRVCAMGRSFPPHLPHELIDCLRA